MWRHQTKIICIHQEGLQFQVKGKDCSLSWFFNGNAHYFNKTHDYTVILTTIMKFPSAESLTNSCSGWTEPQSSHHEIKTETHMYDVCVLHVQCSECLSEQRGREAGWATSNPHPRPIPVFREGNQMRRVRPGAHLYSLQRRQSALTLPVQPPSFSISLSHTSTRQGGESDKPTDR